MTLDPSRRHQLFCKSVTSFLDLRLVRYLKVQQVSYYFLMIKQVSFKIKKMRMKTSSTLKRSDTLYYNALSIYHEKRQLIFKIMVSPTFGSQTIIVRVSYLFKSFRFASFCVQTKSNVFIKALLSPILLTLLNTMHYFEEADTKIRIRCWNLFIKYSFKNEYVN